MHPGAPYCAIHQTPTAQFRTTGWRSMAPAPMPGLGVHGPSLPWPAKTATIAMGRSAAALVIGLWLGKLLLRNARDTFNVCCCSCLWESSCVIHLSFQETIYAFSFVTILWLREFKMHGVQGCEPQRHK